MFLLHLRVSIFLSQEKLRSDFDYFGWGPSPLIHMTLIACLPIRQIVSGGAHQSSKPRLPLDVIFLGGDCARYIGLCLQR